MTPQERDTVAFEMIQEAFRGIRGHGMKVREELDARGLEADSDDLMAILAGIDEGWEMFHEIWSMGS